MEESFDFQLTHDQATGITVAQLKGDLDMYSAEVVRRRLYPLAEMGRRFWVMDLGAVPFIDSTGLGALVGVMRKVQPSGGEVRLAACPKDLRRAFERVGFDTIFPFHDTVEEAVAAMTHRNPLTTA